MEQLYDFYFSQSSKDVEIKGIERGRKAYKKTINGIEYTGVMAKGKPAETIYSDLKLVYTGTDEGIKITEIK